jgi:hypothetical protein
MRRLARWVVPAVLLAWWASPALAAAQLPGARPVAAATAPADPSEGRAAASEVAPAAAGDYAAREARAQKLEQWTGGYEGGVYIGGSAVAFALLIVLLVLVLR